MVVVPTALGIAAWFGTARQVPAPKIFRGVGAAVFGVCAVLGLAWLARLAPTGGIGLAAVLAAGVGATIPVAAPGRGLVPVSGQHYWHLPDGSSLAYVRVKASGVVRPEPMVFVHGGPGTPDMAGDAAFFGQLAADGFDVYIYDGLGSGCSTRLQDVTGYPRNATSLTWRRSAGNSAPRI